MSENDKNIVYGGPEIVDFDSIPSVGHYLLEKLELNSHHVALVDGITGEQMTYGQIRAKSIDLAKALTTFGLKKGDTVGLCSENRMEFSTILVAALNLGITVAPMNFTYSERELNHAFSLSKPKLMFASPIIVEKILNVVKQNKYVKRVVQLGKSNAKKGATLFNEFIQQFTRPKQQFNSIPINIYEDVALILCSSGTTGQPKGVQLTHLNILSGIFFYNEQLDSYEKEDNWLAILGVIPWFHAYGCLTLIAITASIAKLVFLPRFDEVHFLSCIQDHKINLLNLVPPLMVFLAKHPLVSKYNLSSITNIICGAAPLSKELSDAVQARIGVRTIRQGYGMSETTLSVSLQIEFLKPGSVGGLAKGIWGKVIDPDTGKILGPNQPGELCFKGTQIMKGYIGNDKATKDILDKNGWLHTGDIGYYDEDKQWYIIERLKELIKYKGFQVPPAELEAILLTNTKVKDAACIGLPDEESGELPMAFVVKQANAEITEEEIIKYVDERISKAKRLRGGVRFINEIPKNPSGKILRRELRAMIQKQKSKL